jgi:DNA-binding GntR family transcriptional regulator
MYSTKAEVVYKSLLNEIIENKLTPGTRLIVKELANKFSVSDIPVREALKMLESTGLIETKPYAGSVVTSPSPEWIEEVFVMRAALEGMAIRTSMPFLNDEDIKNIIDIDNRMKAEKNNHMEYARLNREFHKTVMGKSPYPNLLNLIGDLLVKSEYGKAIFGMKPTTVVISDREHDTLIEALKNHDVDLAETITKNHRLRVGSELADAIRKLKSVDKKAYEREENNNNV